MGLKEYKQKRDFKKTSEPKATVSKTRGNSFVIQKHAASHLHYDFRLELDGVLKSWAVPKGPSLDSKQKRLAVEVEDHPLDYGKFEGKIPEGEYGAGDVIVWDRGEWIPVGDAHRGLKKGRLEFDLHGEKLRGRWILVRTRSQGSKPNWLLMKRTDEFSVAEIEFNVVTEKTASVMTGENLPGEKRIATKKKRETATVEKALKKFPLPSFIEPQLAKLATAPPVGSDWIHEVKFDGYRTLVRIQEGKAKLYTRSGLDWSSKYGALTKELCRLPVKSAWIDGEICIPNAEGKTQFHLLQRALTEGKSKDLVLYAFDLLECDGEDLRHLPLVQRKMKLSRLLTNAKLPHLVYSDHFTGKGSSLLQKACELGMEGIISKVSGAPYSSGRGRGWIKSKCGNEQEFIIAGYIESESRSGFGSLLLAVPEGKNYRYLGRVGTGFDAQDIRTLMKAFRSLKTDLSPFATKVPSERSVQWLRPELLAQIAFTGWTGEGHLRHASFKGLRFDKPAKEVRVEVPERKTKLKSNAKSEAKNGRAEKSVRVKLTHPEKVLIPDVNVTKKDIADYYTEISAWILPHVKNRPLSLLRCPDGIGEACFFQKNLRAYRPSEIEVESIRSPKGKIDQLIYLENIDGLTALTQMGVLEIHSWGTHRDHALNPDVVVFDLDPGPGVAWKAVVQGALDVRDTLANLGLESFVKVSGGKGFHIHVPIAPRYTWAEVKEFSKTIARHLENESPELYVSAMTKAKRNGRIFIDYLRNGYGATSVAPYSLRARPGGAIALPIFWSEVKKVKADGFDMKATLKRLRKEKSDPWQGYFKMRQKISILEK